MINIEFTDTALETAFHELRGTNSSSHRALARAIGKAIDELGHRHREGRVLKGEQIPAYYRRRDGLDHVRCLDIPPHWRVFYAVYPDRIVIIDLTCDGFTGPKPAR